jgi:hypothetical protein
MSTEQIIVNDVAIQTSVAPIEATPVEVAVKQTKEKKPKNVSDTPKLAPRFQKFIDFGFWVALQLKNKNLINDDVFQTILTDIKMNDGIDVQTDFYTNYEKSGKSGKPTVSPDAPSLAAEGLEGVAEVKSKAKKSRKPTVVGKPTVSPTTPSLPVEGLEVKPKAKRSRKPTGRDSTPDAPSLSAGDVEVKPKAKKVRKPKVVASDAETGVVEGLPVEGVPVEGSEVVPVEEKPKAKKARKPKASTPLSNSNDIIHDLLSHAQYIETVQPLYGNK